MMRRTGMFALLVPLVITAAAASVEPETSPPRMATLPAPTPGWFMLNGERGTYIFDGDSGEMQGLISHNWYTPAIEPNIERNEFYLVDSFYSRGVTGERTDVLTIVDLPTLSTKAEVVIPAKTAALSFRHHIGMLGDKRHVVVFNMSPAQSLSIVDVIDREFAGEISTPGCAMIMPTGRNAFLMICGDGTLQLIRLDEDGNEVKRVRSKQFFVVEDDPVFAMPLETDAGWLLVTHDGRVFDVTVDDDDIAIGKPWSILDDTTREEKWRPGGGQPLALNRPSGLLYVLMHQGEVDTHSEPGSEVWVVDTARKRRIGRMPLEVAATNILVSDEVEPKLYVYGTDLKLQVIGGHSLRRLRTIDDLGERLGLWLMQTL